MTKKMESFIPSLETPLANILLNVAPIVRAIGLMVGSSFFCVILLIGIGIALQRPTPFGAGVIMVVAVLMAIWIALLIAYLVKKIHCLMEKLQRGA